MKLSYIAVKMNLFDIMHKLLYEELLKNILELVR